MGPVVLDALHVPLVDNDHYFLAFTLVDVVEKVFVTFVYEDLLGSWEEYVCTLDIPVDKVRISTFLRESLRSCLGNFLSVTLSLIDVRRLIVLEPLH